MRGLVPGSRRIGLEEVDGPDGSHWLIGGSAAAKGDRHDDAASRTVRDWIEAHRHGGPFACVEGAAGPPVKRGDDRSVWRVTLRGGVFFVKIHEGSSRLAALLRRGWYGSAAESEWERLLDARRGGVDTIGPVAVGVDAHAFGRSALITAAFGGGRSLADAWTQARGDRRVRLALLEAAARLMAVMCRVGIRHRDLHPHNILVAGAPSRPHLALADLYGSRRARRGVVLPAALAQLDQFFQRVASRSERVRFVRTLQEQLWPDESGSAKWNRRRAMLIDVVRAKAKWGKKLARTRDRRLRGDGKYFARIELGSGWSGRVVLRVARRHAVPAGDTPDMTVGAWRVRLAGLTSPADGSPDVSGDGERHVPVDGKRHVPGDGERHVPGEGKRHVPGDVTWDVPGDVERVVRGAMRRDAPGAAKWDTNWDIERFRPRGTLQSIGWRWFGSPAAREFTRDHRLRHRDVAAPLRLAALDRRSRGRVLEAILITAQKPTCPQRPPTTAESRPSSP